MKVQVDQFGRPVCGCINHVEEGGLFRDMQENPCKDAFKSCNGLNCKHFAVLTDDGELHTGENADILMGEFWEERFIKGRSSQ